MKLRDILNESNGIDYRILTKDRKIKYAGTGHDSWFTLEKAKKLVDRKSGEMIYYFDPTTGRQLWEVL